MNKKWVLNIGVDWSKVARHQAMIDLKVENPKIAKIINVLDKLYRNRKIR